MWWFENDSVTEGLSDDLLDALVQGQSSAQQESPAEDADARDALLSEIASLRLRLETESRLRRQTQQQLDVVQRQCAEGDQKNKSLRSELAALKDALAHAESARGELTSTIAQTEIEHRRQVEQLRQDRSRVGDSLRETVARFESLAAENTALREHLEAESSRHERETRELRALRSHREEHVGQLEKIVADLEEAVASRDAAHRQLTEDLARTEAERQRVLEELRHARQETETRFQALVAEHELLRLAHVGVQSELEASRLEYARSADISRELLVAREQELAESRDQIRSLRESLKQSKAARANLESAARQARADRDKESQSLKQQHAEASARIEELAAELETLGQRNCDLGERYQAGQAELRQTVRDLTELSDLHQQRIREFAAEKSALHEGLTRSEQARRELESAKASVDEAHRFRVEELQQSRQAELALEEKLSRLREEHAAELHRLEAAFEGERSQYSNAIEELRTESVALEQKSLESETVAAELRVELQNQKKVGQDLAAEFASVQTRHQEEVSSLRDSLTEARDRAERADAARVRLDSVVNEKELAHSRLVDMRRREQELAGRAATALEAEIARLTQANNRQRENAEEQRRKSEEEYEHLRRNAEALESRLRAASEKLEAATVNLEQAREEAAKHQRDASSARVQLVKIEEECERRLGALNLELERLRPLAAASKAAEQRSSELAEETRKLQLHIEQLRERARLDESKKATEAAEQHGEQEIARLQQRLNDVGSRARKEACGRRKAESALRRFVENPQGDPALQSAQAHLEMERRIERLTHELATTKNHGLRLRQRAMRKIKLAAAEIHRLQAELKSRRPARAAA